MMKPLGALLLVVLTGACSVGPRSAPDGNGSGASRMTEAPAADSGSAQSGPPDGGTDGGFDFGRCADAGVLYYCPGMGEELCRLEVIREAHATGCSSAADCVKTTYEQNCLAYALCEPRPSVLQARAAEFAAAAKVELNAYCSRVNCWGGGLCVDLQTQPVCENGVCGTR